MSKIKTYQVALSKEPSVVIEKARKTAGSNGFEFAGDEMEGRFAGKGLQGRYRIEGAQMSIMIDKKPLILPWSLIESSIKSFFV
ncbi:hypothetical protein [Methylotetracoccus oryzae]|uniref:hypothetical protein n=1 Tax=Methylotetracoccus oryzae TaxID=1919059 RepID=UPI00111A43FA|nr:hypothetical protein [Methylotetracoccus oryzae]